MEVSALHTFQRSIPGLRGPSPLLRLQSDERLIALTRRGQHAAFEALCSRYQSRLLVLLPPHARLARGRRGRPAGGLRRRLQRGARRRARDQRAPVALPDRAQPLAQPPAPRDRRSASTRWTSTSPSTASRPSDKVMRRESFRELIADVHAAARDAAHRAAAARDRRALLRADRARDGDDRAVGQVAARARAHLARRGRRGAQAELRRGPPRARRSRRGPRQAEPARAPPRARLRALPRPSRSSSRRTTTRSPRCCPSAPLLHAQEAAPRQARPQRLGRRRARRRRARAPPPAPARPPAPVRPAVRSLAGGVMTAGAGALATKAVAGLAAAAIVTAGAVAADHR